MRSPEITRVGNTLGNTAYYADHVNWQPEVAPNGHVQVIGGRGNRRWRAFWWDADGKHSRVLGKAWAQNSGKRTPRGAIIWHSADGRKPDSSYLHAKSQADDAALLAAALAANVSDGGILEGSDSAARPA